MNPGNNLNYRTGIAVPLDKKSRVWRGRKGIGVSGTWSADLMMNSKKEGNSFAFVLVMIRIIVQQIDAQKMNRALVFGRITFFFDDIRCQLLRIFDQHLVIHQLKRSDLSHAKAHVQHGHRQEEDQDGVYPLLSKKYHRPKNTEFF